MLASSMKHEYKKNIMKLCYFKHLFFIDCNWHDALLSQGMHFWCSRLMLVCATVMMFFLLVSVLRTSVTSIRHLMNSNRWVTKFLNYYILFYLH